MIELLGSTTFLTIQAVAGSVAGIGLAILVLAGIAVFSAYASPYYPAARFVLKQFGKRRAATV